MLQVRDDGENWLDHTYILKVVSVGFAAGVCMECERKLEIKNDSNVSHLCS